MRLQWLGYSLILIGLGFVSRSLVGCITNAPKLLNDALISLTHPKISSPVLMQDLSLSDNSLTSTPEPQIQYKVYDLPASQVHTLLIPVKSRFQVTVGLSSNVDTLENFARTHQAFAVLNGGFFDPKNRLTTSYVVQKGKISADPRKNERLMENPHLTPYKNQILNRSEWRRYQCGDKIKYAIAFHQESTPKGCQLIDAIGGGPQLLPKITATEEGFLDAARGRDALGMNRPNARTAIGITHDGDLIWVMVAQKTGKSQSAGLSLSELAAFLKTLGVEVALNLDGGSSSALYYQDRTIYGKVDEEGQLVKRPVKSVLLVK